MYDDYIPNERIVDRAIQIWISLLSKPKYDTLGKNSPENIQSQMQCMTAALIADKLPKNNTPEVLSKFGQELKKFLMGSECIRNDTQFTRIVNYLSVDYHPDSVLREAAERSGLRMEFPWKTHMQLTNDFVWVKNGYGDDRMYHYPLSHDRWLVTTLYGSDISKVIKLVEDGKVSVDLE